MIRLSLSFVLFWRRDIVACELVYMIKGANPRCSASRSTFHIANISAITFVGHGINWA